MFIADNGVAAKRRPFVTNVETTWGVVRVCTHLWFLVFGNACESTKHKALKYFCKRIVKGRQSSSNLGTLHKCSIDMNIEWDCNEAKYMKM